MLIYTSSWSRYTGPGRIGISRGGPRNSTAGYRFYRDLAPTRDILSTAMSQPEYRLRFFAEVLGHLNQVKVVQDLTKLANGATPVLLCFENAPLHEHNWCHRTMVAEWLMRVPGFTVEEWSGVSELNREQTRLDV